MKNSLLLFVFLTSLGGKILAQSSFYRTGYFQLWSSGNYTNKSRFVNEYSGEPGIGILKSSTIDSMGNSAWQPFRRELAANAETDSASLVDQWWKVGVAAYVDSTRGTVIKHPVTHKPLRTRHEVWSGTSWQNSSLLTYTHNGSGHLQELVSSVWIGTWVNKSRKKHFTNSNGWPLVTHHDSLIGTVWVTNQIDSSTFDANGNKIEMTSWKKNQLGVFAAISLETATFSGLNQMVTQTFSILFPGGNMAFPITFKTIVPGEDACNNETVQFNSVLPPGAPIWQNSNRIIWEPFNGVVANRERGRVRVFPNPLEGKVLHIKTTDLNASKCEILDAMGRKVAQFEFVGKELEIQTGDLPKGIFYLRLQDGQNNFLSSHAIWH